MSMHPEKIVVGKKLVWPRKPYLPNADMMVEFVAQEEVLKMVAAAWLSGAYSQPLSPLLVGPPGCGKNRLVYEMAQRMGLDLYVCQGYENITAEELACSLVVADEGHGRIEYLLSAPATALLKGGICFIDEIGKFPGKALALLASVLDDRKYIDLDLIGERIQAHPQFRFIAATNSEDVETLPDFIRSRLFPIIRVEKPAPELINNIIQRQFPHQHETIGKLLSTFWRLWDQNSEIGESPSPRHVIQIFSLASKLADFNELASGGQTNWCDVPLEHGTATSRISEEHLECAFEQFLELREEMAC